MERTKRWLCTAALLAAGLFVPHEAQAGADPEFDAASLKVIPRATSVVIGSGGSVSLPVQAFRYTPGRVTCVLPLRDLIQEAFDVKSWQISGPSFLDGDYQSLEATMPAQTARGEARLMLRSLLQSRYQLRFHMEQKNASVYALAVDKSGLKIRPLAEERRRAGFGGGLGRFTGSGVTLPQLASALTGRSERPVVDETKTPGQFDLDFTWTPEPDERPGDTRPLPAGLVESMRTQAGLRLEPRQTPVEILVIDHIEKKPSAN